MFRPVEMCKINVLVLNKHLDEVTLCLGKKGLIHPVNAVEQSRGHLLSNLDDHSEQQALSTLLSRCEKLISLIGLEQNADVPDPSTMSREDIAALLDRLSAQFDEQEEKLLTLANGAAASSTPLQSASLEVIHPLTQFTITAGCLKSALIPEAMSAIAERGLLLPVEGTEDGTLLLTSPDKQDKVMKTMVKLGFVTLAGAEGTVGKASFQNEQLMSRLIEQKKQLEECRCGFEAISKEAQSVLPGVRAQLRSQLAVINVRRNFGQTKQLACISGWIPKASVNEIRKLVDDVTHSTGIVEITDAEDDEFVKAGQDSIPVKFVGGALCRPFHMLINNFGVPTYHEIDPTIFVGITFVLMFGFMFGDIGQGLVLLLAGLWLKFTKRKFDETLRDSGTLLACCGGCATLFGIAYGSVFGYENHEFLKPLWLSPLKDINTLLITAVSMGVVFSSVAIIINIINHFHAKKYYDGTFDRFGLLGLVFYWIALVLGLMTMVFNQSLASVKYMLCLIIVPLVLLFIKEPLHNILHKHWLFHKSNFLTVFLEGLIELMETFTGYLSGTVSFIRVGAFAISHASLCLAVFTIVKMLNNFPDKFAWLGVILQALIVVAGNILVICFEGMVAMIQGVRLEYYELFSKYFNGGGVAYKPFDLKNPEDSIDK